MKAMSTLGVGLFLSVFFAVGFGVLGFGLRSVVMSYAARTWPTVWGRVESCELTSSSDSDGTTYRAVARYSYTVGGVSYEGSRIAFGYSGSSGDAAHREIVGRLSSAKAVRVRYDPKKPSRAVLSCGLNRSILFTLIFGVTWLFFVSGFTLLWGVVSRSDSALLETLETDR